MSLFDTTDKQALMVAALTHLGVRFREHRQGWQKVSCPSAFHVRGDRNPSASVNVEAGLFPCHARPLRGDGFDLMRGVENLDARAVLALLGLTQEDGRDMIGGWVL